jgi:hypothetical protein
MEVTKLVFDRKSNKKDRMTSHIMVEWLTAFNSQLKQHKHHVILFLVNETCHPRSELSNARLEWVFPNITSVFQLMDKGVIKCATLNYRKLLMRSLLAMTEAASLPTHPSLDRWGGKAGVSASGETRIVNETDERNVQEL